MSETFRDSAEALAPALNSRGDAVKDMLAARLQAFEDMFNHGGTELTEKISRDADTLGSLITRHIAEFDRTVKTYGGELVERLGQRTQDVSEAMRNYLDTLRPARHRPSRRTVRRARPAAVAVRAATRLGVAGITSTLAAGGKEVVEALDQRIAEVAEHHQRARQRGRRRDQRQVGEIDQTLGARALEVADNLDSRIGRFEELLVGRAETVTTQIETRTKAAADALNARMEQLSQSIKVNAAEAENSLGQLALATTDAIRASAGEAERTLLGVERRGRPQLRRQGRRDRHDGHPAHQRNDRHLSDKSGGVLAAITEKGQQFAGEVGMATDQAIKSIEEKGFAFTRTMLDNCAEIARTINVAGETAANSVTRTLNELHDDGAEGDRAVASRPPPPPSPR